MVYLRLDEVDPVACEHHGLQLLEAGELAQRDVLQSTQVAHLFVFFFTDMSPLTIQVR